MSIISLLSFSAPPGHGLIEWILAIGAPLAGAVAVFFVYRNRHAIKKWWAAGSAGAIPQIANDTIEAAVKRIDQLEEEMERQLVKYESENKFLKDQLAATRNELAEAQQQIQELQSLRDSDKHIGELMSYITKVHTDLHRTGENGR